MTPLGLASIEKFIETLGSIFDEAIEDEHIEPNPTRVSRTRIKAPQAATALVAVAGAGTGLPVLDPVAAW